MDTNASDLVKSASRTLQVFEAFSEAGRVQSLAEISQALKIPRSSCLALLRTLLSHGYLYQIGGSGYYPTNKMCETAEVIARHDPLIERVRPVMTMLRDLTQETVILGKRQAGRVIYLVVVESEQMIRYSTHAGEFKPLHATASGKVLLGSMGREERRRLLEQLLIKPFTSQTITDIRELEKDLLRGSARGWQQVEGENVSDVVAIAAPVVLNGETYALVVTGPIHRMKKNLDQHGKVMIVACRCLEAGLPLEGSRPESGY
jgi:DNA-binding IclR family transcriptional regulator